MRRLVTNLFILSLLVLTIGCDTKNNENEEVVSLTEPQSKERAELIKKLEYLEDNLPTGESLDITNWQREYRDYWNQLHDNFNYEYSSDYSHFRNLSWEFLQKQTFIELFESKYMEWKGTDNEIYRDGLLIDMAQSMIDCEGYCKSEYMSYEKAQEINEQ